MSKIPAEETINELIAAYRRGDFAGAERMARRVTRKWPEFDLGWNVLSAALHARGKLNKASDAYLNAIALNPGYAELRDNFGALLLQRGRIEEAETHFREAIKLNPRSSKTHGNLAMALLMRGSADEAAEHARAAVELDPRNASAHNTLGNALKALHRYGEARGAYETAVDLDPDYAKAHYNLATVLQELERTSDAERHYRLAVKSDPNYAKARCGLGNLLAMLGRLEDAEQVYRETLRIRPDHAEAHRYLAWIKVFHQVDADLKNIEGLLSKSGTPDRDRAQLHYAAGKAYQDLGDRPGQAFSHFLKGAALRRREISYDVAADENLFTAIARACETFPVMRAAGSGREAATPVFIVGMPRSGTTLVEQIVAAHTGVYAGGESEALANAVGEMDRKFGCAYPDWVRDLSEPELAAMAESYLRAFRPRLAGARTFTDKMPENFKYLGIIAAALPRARIIHVRRAPLDTCVSAFTQYFSSLVPYSYDLGELGRYYRGYRGLMDLWRRVLPAGTMLEVQYEDLTREPEAQARRLIDYCRLDWQDGCLNFQSGDRLVQTASVAQARQGIHRQSVGRWQQYGDYLKPLIDELGDLASGSCGQ